MDLQRRMILCPQIDFALRANPGLTDGTPSAFSK
jgi:hypothetical protein